MKCTGVISRGTENSNCGFPGERARDERKDVID